MPARPKAGPVQTIILKGELRSYLKEYGDRVQVINDTTIVVWNSAEQKNAMMRKKGRR